MRLSQFDLNQLLALDALLTEKSVSKAAERMFLSQSAMSSALGRLRESFGDKLLISVGRKMILTPLGNQLAQPVREVLMRIQAITSMAPDFDPQSSERTIMLVGSDYLGPVFLCEALRRASLEAPKVKILMRPVDSDYPEQLERGDIDLVISPDIFSLKDYPSELLFQDTYCCIAWSQNERIANSISVGQYQETGQVVLELGQGRVLTYDEWWHRHSGQSRNTEIVVPYYSLLPHFVIGTGRIATIQTRLARCYAQYLPLKLLPLPFEMPPRVEVLQYHQYQELDRAHTWFRNLLHEVARDLIAKDG